MREAGNRASIDHHLSTDNVGEILPAERASRAWPPGNAGRAGRNSFMEPGEFTTGSNGCVGGGDPWNTNECDLDDIAGRSHA